jgi:hypothetical protein
MMTTLLTLMKKDWRVFRGPVIACVILGVVPYLVVFAAAFVPDHYHTSWRQQFTETISGAAVCSLIVTGVFAGIFASAAFAAERNDRSADFLLLLPPRRIDILLSKLAVAVPWLILCFAVHCIICVAGVFAMSSESRYFSKIQFNNPLDGQQNIAYGVVGLFGMAWMFSTFLRSTAISMCIPLVTVIATAAFVGLASSLLEWSQQRTLDTWCLFSLVIGFVCFAAGTAHYLRRVEP